MTRSVQSTPLIPYRFHLFLVRHFKKLTFVRGNAYALPLTKVKRILPGLDNFFMAGQWVVPGGGVIPTLTSGKHAAMLMCRRDGKAFKAFM